MTIPWIEILERARLVKSWEVESYPRCVDNPFIMGKSWLEWMELCRKMTSYN